MLSTAGGTAAEVAPTAGDCGVELDPAVLVATPAGLLIDVPVLAPGLSAPVLAVPTCLPDSTRFDAPPYLQGYATSSRTSFCTRRSIWLASFARLICIVM
jgi:hypothetical protein